MTFALAFLAMNYTIKFATVIKKELKCCPKKTKNSTDLVLIDVGSNIYSSCVKKKEK